VRVLVVDDSMLFRKVVRDALAQEAGVEVVGWAADGRAALQKIDQLHPDAITLDLEMPDVDGLEVLRQLQKRPAPPGVIVVSALSDAGATMTAQALRLGAFDFVLKPNGANIDENRLRLEADLLPKIRLLAERRNLTLHAEHSAAKCDLVFPSKKICTLPQKPPEIVAIGISTGGPSALHTMLPKLPADLPVPVVIVQHMPAKFTRSLAEDLDRRSKVHVKEAEDGERLQPGTVYIAPGGRQMKIEAQLLCLKVRVTDDPPEKCCKPSVDYLFRSLADQIGARVLAVIMTGMGDDGTVGCKLLKQRGALVLAQDAASCVVYGMPRQVIESGLADMVRPLDGIAEAIEQAVCSRAAAC
jgi:two-component system, chemotaxis family, protein-glutamate methylesterase/glutaminase